MVQETEPRPLKAASLQTQEEFPEELTKEDSVRGPPDSPV